MDQDLARAILVAIPSRAARPRSAQHSWREVGSCRDLDPNLFYPVGTGAPAVKQAEEAKRLCATCPSVEPCLAFALATRQELGVWGGTSPDERRLLIRAQRAQVAS
jgi:WhiB family redox-sensing transcriptional regulator